MSEANAAQIDNLVSLLDGYATKGGHHLNVNVFSKETLLGKIKCPELLSISEIKTENDILMIRNEKVRGEFENSFAETKDIKKTVKELKDIYPQLWIYKEYFVSRESILGLLKKILIL